MVILGYSRVLGCSEVGYPKLYCTLLSEHIGYALFTLLVLVLVTGATPSSSPVILKAARRAQGGPKETAKVGTTLGVSRLHRLLQQVVRPPEYMQMIWRNWARAFICCK